mmetsp:Transcript_10040/g.28067  ORF Transcript_10040/g.28067 Transcript_10040/m.28067 type:complete len:101 (-) Transcript_10040:9-311(-)
MGVEWQEEGQDEEQREGEDLLMNTSPSKRINLLQGREGQDLSVGCYMFSMVDATENPLQACPTCSTTLLTCQCGHGHVAICSLLMRDYFHMQSVRCQRHA